MRVPGRRTVLALAAVVLASLPGCTGSAAEPPATRAASPPTATAPAPSPPAEPAVTLQEAAEVFATFTATDNVVRAGRDLRFAMKLTRDAEARLTAVAFLSTGHRPPQRAWGRPTLYVPRFPAGERYPWFTVLAARDGRPALLTFARDGDWRLSAASELLEGQRPPEIVLDAEGYATRIAAADRSVTVSPQYLGPLHATAAEAGAEGAHAGLLAPGPYTTEVAAEITKAREKAKKNGFSYDSIFTANDFPVYGLRTRDGGAVIQYALSRTTTMTTKTAEDDYIPVPDQAQWSIKASVVRRSLRLTEVHTYVTAVPPATAPAAARVIAHDGALTRATGQ